MKQPVVFSILLLLITSSTEVIETKDYNVQISIPITSELNGIIVTLHYDKIESLENNTMIKAFINEYAIRADDSEFKYLFDYSILDDCSVQNERISVRPHIQQRNFAPFNQHKQILESINLVIAGPLSDQEKKDITFKCLKRKEKVNRLISETNILFSDFTKANLEITNYKEQLKSLESTVKVQQKQLSDYLEYKTAYDTYKNITLSISNTYSRLTNSTEKSEIELSKIIGKTEDIASKISAEINATNASIYTLTNELKHLFKLKLDTLQSIDNDFSFMNSIQYELNELDDEISSLNQTKIQFTIEVQILKERIEESNRKLSFKNETLIAIESNLKNNISRLNILNQSSSKSKSLIKEINEEVMQVNNKIQALELRKRDLQKNAYEIMKEQEKNLDEISYLNTQSELLRTEKKLMLLELSRIEKSAKTTNTELKETSSEIEKLSNSSINKITQRKNKEILFNEAMQEKEKFIEFEKKLNSQIDLAKSKMEQLKLTMLDKQNMMEKVQNEMVSHAKHLRKDNELLHDFKTKMPKLGSKISNAIDVDNYDTYLHNLEESKSKYKDLKEKLSHQISTLKEFKAKLITSFESLVEEVPSYSGYVNWLSIMINEDLNKLSHPLFT